MQCLTEELRDNKINKYKNIVLFDWHPLIAFELSTHNSNLSHFLLNSDSEIESDPNLSSP